MTNDQKKQLEAQLWNIADSLRGKMNADEFRDYCLGFIFYKYLSERQYIYANEILSEDDLDYLDIEENSELGQAYLEAVKDESITKLGYFLKPSELFHSLAIRALGAKKAEEDNLKDEDFAQSNFILDDLKQVLNSIEKSTMGNESEEDFDHLFEDLDLTSTKLGRTPKDKNALIAKILVHLDKIDFRLKDSESDVLGDAYEYLIAQFASGAGKKAGEFYTPQAVSKVLAKIVTTGKERLKSVYDPTCGSGSLLLRVAKEVKQVGDYFGQEMNRTTYNLARMNMILHGVHYGNFNLCQEDTLERPQHLGKKFEAVVANPPFSANWSANKLFESDDRFSQYGALAPKSKADFAFVQHMIHHLADNGIMAVVLPHGVLFRGATEGRIRQYLIKERNWLDAVIGLPANIFYGTSIPTCILVFKKCREYPNDILFIDGSGHFEKAKNQNYLRDQDIDKIINTYRGRLVEERYSYRASLAEIAENDFNLNIPRYVDTFEEEEDIDLEQVVLNLAEVQEIFDSVDEKINKYCFELGISEPKGCNLHLLECYKRGVMQLLFTQKIRFKNDDCSDFPAWEVKKLGNIANRQTKKNDDNKISVVLTNSATKGVICQQDYFDKDIANADNLLGYYVIDKGDYVYNPRISIHAPVGPINKNKIGLGVMSPLYTIFRFKNQENTFYEQYFKTSFWYKYMCNIANYGARHDRMNITNNDFMNLPLPCPSPKEQEKIANFLTAIDKKIEAVGRQIEGRGKFKQGLLQKMFV